MTEQTKALTPIQQIQQTVEGPLRERIESALDGTGLSPERFIRSALVALNNNPYLVDKCDRGSLYTAIQEAAIIGLELHPSLGQAAIVPRKGKATVDIMYKGLLQLAYHSGKITSVDAGAIYENDSVVYEDGTTPTLRVQRAFPDRGKAYAYYAVVHYTDGPAVPTVMTVDEIQRHRDENSPGYKKDPKSPWRTHFDEMAKKTVVKRALKLSPVKILGLSAAGDGGDTDAPPANDFNPETGEIIDAQPVKPAAPTGASRLDTFAGADA